MPRVFVALALLSLVAACTSKDDSSAVDASTDAPIACTSNADCPAQSGCLYPVAESCGATGQCVHVPVGFANCGVDPSLRFCGCDGGSFSPGCAYGTDFYPYPVAHVGACTDGAASGQDAGATDATGDGGLCPSGCEPTPASTLCTDTACFCRQVVNQVPSNCQPGTASLAPPWKAMYCCD